MRDTAETIHFASYGKSGRASANAGNGPFLKGFGDGKDSGEGEEDPWDDVETTYHMMGKPKMDSAAFEIFSEWKRGYYAARLQRAFARRP